MGCPFPSTIRFAALEAKRLMEKYHNRLKIKFVFDTHFETFMG
jgi:hypothetical protein